MILGEMANTPENGHTFLSYYLTTHGWDRVDSAELEWNARESERTIGLSQYGLFSIMTKEKLEALEVLSPIGYSARTGLDLQIRDALQEDEPNPLRENQENDLKGLHSSLSGSGREGTVKIISENWTLCRHGKARAVCRFNYWYIPYL